MRWYKIAALTVGVGAIGCQTPSMTPVEIRVAEDIVQNQLRTWERYINNRQIDSALTLYQANDALSVVWTSGVRTTGMADHEVQLNSFYDAIQYLNLGIQSPTVNVMAPNVASVSFRYSIDVQMNDTSRDPYAGQGLQIWTREDEDSPWLIQNHMMTRNP